MQNIQIEYDIFLKKVNNFYSPIFKKKFVDFLKSIEEKNQEMLTEEEKEYVEIHKSEKKNFENFYEQKSKKLESLYNIIDDLFIKYNKSYSIVKSGNLINIQYTNILCNNINSTIRDTLFIKNEYENEKFANFSFKEFFQKHIDFLKKYDFNEFSKNIIYEYENIFYTCNHIDMTKNNINSKEFKKIIIDNKEKEIIDFHLTLLNVFCKNIHENLPKVGKDITSEIEKLLSLVEILEKDLNGKISDFARQLENNKKNYNTEIQSYNEKAQMYITKDKKKHLQFNDKSIYNGY
jgi:hypothetical protein